MRTLKIRSSPKAVPFCEMEFSSFTAVITTHLLSRTVLRPPVILGIARKEFEVLMERCWHPDPHLRPSFVEVSASFDALAGIRPGTSYVDMVVRRLEKYAEDLELQVADRTHTLMEEMHKTEVLLMEILPL